MSGTDTRDFAGPKLTPHATSAQVADFGLARDMLNVTSRLATRTIGEHVPSNNFDDTYAGHPRACRTMLCPAQNPL